MNSDPEGRAPQIETTWYGGTTTTTYTYSVEDRPPDPVWLVEHEREQGTFRLTGPDGKTERFRSQPLRYLVVEPDAQTGAMTPVLRNGRPWFLNLCREEPEGR